MRVMVVGYGVQGKKRRRVAGADFVGIVDPVAPDADWREITAVPLDRYDAALVCMPDAPKIEILDYLLRNGKHVLVEKPLQAADDAELETLERTARSTGTVCYTAYNHRFEPHYVRMRDLLKSGVLGDVYRCRMFYGNGTARLVRDSAWRDQGAGVLPDLGSHLLDTARFWFGDIGDDFQLVSVGRFENRAPDHVVFAAPSRRPQLEFEMTLLSWRNHFTCDVFAKAAPRISSRCVNGARRPSPIAAGSCRADVRPRRRSRWCRTIRPGSWNTRISRSSSPIACRPISAMTAGFSACSAAYRPRR